MTKRDSQEMVSMKAITGLQPETIIIKIENGNATLYMATVSRPL